MYRLNICNGLSFHVHSLVLAEMVLLSKYLQHENAMIESHFLYNKLLGPTEPAHSVIIEERSSHTAKVSWISGHNGGSQQIFVVQFKTVDEIAYNSSPLIEDTGLGSKLYYNINNLQENTVYRIKVIAMNSYRMQQHRVENIVTFKTLRKFAKQI